MKLSPTLGLLLLQCFFLSPNVNAQSWEVYFDHPSFAQVYTIIPHHGPDNGVRLAIPESYNPNPTVVHSFDKTGDYLGENALPWTSNWSILSGDKSGASYWTTHYKVRKLNVNNQVVWTYVPPVSAGIFWVKPTPVGAGCFQYSTNSPFQQVIDYLDSDGQLVNRFTFPNDWPDEYYPGSDYSLIYTDDSFGTGTIHWVKVNQSNQVVWEQDLDDQIYFLQGSLPDGSTLAYNRNTYNLIKFNAAGAIEWERSMQSYFPSSNYVEMGQILVREDGSIILSAGYNLDFNEFKVAFINLSPLDGNANWIRTLESTTEVLFINLSNPLVEMPDGGVLACLGPFWDSGNGDQVLLVRTDPNGYTLSQQITGRIYQEENNNCTPDASEKPMKQVSVIAQSGTKKYSATTDLDGNFSMATAQGNYTLSFAQLGSYWNYCGFQNPVTIDTDHDSVFVSIGTKASVICPELFLSIGSPVFRRCFDNNYLNVQYQNSGTAPALNAYVTVTLDPKLIYLSSTAPLLSQSGQTYKFDIGTVDIGEIGTFTINFKVDCDATLGEELCVDSHIYPDTICIPTAEAYVDNAFCLPVVVSYDPNDKTAFVNGKPETAKILPDLGLEYLIRFQNTGNDTAFNIVVADTLSSRLDPASVIPGASSHPYTFELRDGNILLFNFRQILLPDSNINEAASHGFVKFHIRQTPGNPIGSALSNTAAITFDYNLPIITNESRLVVSTEVRSNEPMVNWEAQTWPVPAHDRVEVLLPAGAPAIFAWKLVDLNGKVVRTGGAESPNFSIRRNGLPGGVYWAQLMLNNGSIAMGRIVFD